MRVREAESTSQKDCVGDGEGIYELAEHIAIGGALGQGVFGSHRGDKLSVALVLVGDVGKPGDPYDVSVINPPVDGPVHLVKAKEGVHRFVVIPESLVEVNRPAMVFPRVECGISPFENPST